MGCCQSQLTGAAGAPSPASAPASAPVAAAPAAAAGSPPPGAAGAPPPSPAGAAPSAGGSKTYATSLRSQATQKQAFLANLKLMVIDNSVRESTVGQVKGHTLADKHRFTELVRSSGIRHQLIATFSPLQRRVDDQFCVQLRDNPDRYAGQVFYSFAEVAGALRTPEELRAGAGPDLEPTIGMVRAHEYRIGNIFFEMDGLCKVLATPRIAIAVLQARIAWFRQHAGAQARIYVNFRDLPLTWDNPASTLRAVAAWLAALPPAERITGIVFEDYTGNTLPALMSAFVAELRSIMATHGWQGDLLIHVHNGFGLAEACVIGSLGSGANGIWCGISREGAASGHANSLTTIMNLIKMGNKDALARFNVAEMRAAAIEMTMICTGAMPHAGTELYGARALDIFFPGGGMGGAEDGPSASALMRVPVKTRVSSLANTDMLADALTEFFGAEPGGWPPAVLKDMFASINRDLLSGTKLDYNTPEGLFALLKRCGGANKRALARLLERRAEETHPALVDFRSRFVERSLVGDVSHDEFFDAFLGGVLSSPATDVGREMLAVFVTDGSGTVNAVEAEWPIIWAVRQYPKECETLDEALSVVLQRIALPALRRKLKLARLRAVFRRLAFALRLRLRSSLLRKREVDAAAA